MATGKAEERVEKENSDRKMRRERRGVETEGDKKRLGREREGRAVGGLNNR